MKKVAFIIAIILTLAMVALPALADSFRMNDDPVRVTVKKTDPSVVVKDGVIGEGEYERFYVDLNEDTSPLNVCYFTGNDVDDAIAMMGTMEYYFSWDEVHGFNFAVRNKPAELKQIIPEGTGDPPQDDFCKNVAYTFIADQQPGLKKLSDTLFYYAVAKDTETGAYKEGHYNQLGLKHYYNPTGGVDFCISYDYGTGYSTIEWSVPFDNFVDGTPAAGTVFYFSVGAEAGPGNTAASDRGYAVALGDWSYLVGARISRSHAIGTLSDEMLVTVTDPGAGEGGDTTEPAGQTDPGDSTGRADPGEPTQPADQGDPTGPADPGEPTQPAGQDDPDPADPEKGDGQADPEDPGDTEDPGDVGTTQPPASGDPMIVIGAVSALSAAGAFIIRRKRK